MKIEITASTLCDLLNGKFTYCACEAICELFEDCAPNECPTLGDIAISFEEMDAEDAKDYEENIVSELENGNVLIAW